MEKTNHNQLRIEKTSIGIRALPALLILSTICGWQTSLAQTQATPAGTRTTASVPSSRASNEANGRFSTPATPACGQDSPDSPMAPTLQQRHQDCVATLGAAAAERCFTFGTRAIPCTNPDGSSPLFTGSHFRLVAQSARGLNQVWLQTRYTYNPGSLGVRTARHTLGAQSDHITYSERASVPTSRASNDANGRFSTPAQASVPPTLVVHPEQLLWTTLSDTPSSPIMAFLDGTPTSQEYCAQNTWGANVKQNLPLIFRLPSMGEVSTAVTGGLANINTQWINQSFWTLDPITAETTYGYHGQIHQNMTSTAAHILPAHALGGANRLEAHHYTHRGFDTEPTHLPVVCVSEIRHF